MGGEDHHDEQRTEELIQQCTQSTAKGRPLSRRQQTFSLLRGAEQLLRSIREESADTTALERYAGNRRIVARAPHAINTACDDMVNVNACACGDWATCLLL